MQLVSKKSLFETMFLGKYTLVKEINNLSDSTNLFDYLGDKMFDLIEEQDDVKLIKNDMIELSQILVKIYLNCGKINKIKDEYFLQCDEMNKIFDDFCAGNQKI